MARSRTTVARWVSTLAIAGFAFAHGVGQLDDRQPDLFHGNFTNDVRRLFNEDRPAQALLGYIEEKNIPVSNLVAVLDWFVTTGIGGVPGAEGTWSEQAIGVMGNLRRAECLPRLVEIARRPDGICRGPAIRAISRIGGSNALAFATTVVLDTNSFSLSDRLSLYEMTMFHAVGGGMEGGSIGEPPDEQRVLARAFLVQDPRSTEKAGWVLQCDEQWSRLVPYYRTNVARVALLSFFRTNAPPPFLQQFDQRLATMLQDQETNSEPTIPVANVQNGGPAFEIPTSSVTAAEMPIVETNKLAISLPSSSVVSPKQGVSWVFSIMGLGCCVVLVYLIVRRK